MPDSSRRNTEEKEENRFVTGSAKGVILGWMALSKIEKQIVSTVSEVLIAEM